MKSCNANGGKKRWRSLTRGPSTWARLGRKAKKLRIRADGAGGDVRMQVSLVIPAYNEERRLSGTLSAYGREMRGRYREGFEIVVVANGCSDGTVGVVNRAAIGDPRIRV